MVVEIYREGDGVEEDVEKKEAKQEGGGSREIRFRGNYVQIWFKVNQILVNGFWFSLLNFFKCWFSFVKLISFVNYFN